MEKRFEILPHTADLQICAYGKDLPTLFKNALFGMFTGISPQFISETKACHDIEVRSHDLETLMVDFLSEALYLSDVHKEAYLDMNLKEISTEGEFFIKAELCGRKIEGFEEGEIKAVTHHGLKVEKKDDHWIAKVLFDL